MAKRILVVDDDVPAREAVAACFPTGEVTVAQAGTGASALEKLRSAPTDLVLTELLLPDLTGLGLCRLIREDPATASIPVVLLTRYAHEIDRVLSFEGGADDFVAKPFSRAELAARVKAILRRPPAQPKRRRDGAQDIRTAARDFSEHLISDATPRELELLAELARREGRVVSREELLERLWDPDSTCSPRTVDAHIKSLRRKLSPARCVIATVRGVGYRLELRSSAGAGASSRGTPHECSSLTRP